MDLTDFTDYISNIETTESYLSEAEQLDLDPLEFAGVCDECILNCEHCAEGWSKGIDNG